MSGYRTDKKRYAPRRQPVQARSQALVDAVLIAAAQVFDAEGYAGATTDRIAERAGVSVGSLYQYFPSKDALLVALFERHLDEVEAAFALLRAELEAGEALAPLARRMVGMLFDLHRAHPGMQRVLVAEAPLPAALLARYESMAAELRDGWAAWLGDSVPAPAEVALLIMSVVEALAHRFTLFAVPEGHAAEALEAATAEVIIGYVERARRVQLGGR